MKRIDTIIVYLIFIIFFIMVWNVITKDKDKNKEGFIPKIREIYHPYIRNINSIYNNAKNSLLYNINKFFRKLGLK